MPLITSAEGSALSKMRNKKPALFIRYPLHYGQSGFTLLEVMISIAIIGALLVTLIYTLNYHLGIAESHSTATMATILANEKIYEMEKYPKEGKGFFPEPYADYYYETSVVSSAFPGMSEIGVMVRKGKEEIRLSELILKAE